jgi:hypothetical protein
MWRKTLADSTAGRPGTEREDGMARDNWWGSVIWEEWEGGVRDHIDKLMARRWVWHDDELNNPRS